MTLLHSNEDINRIIANLKQMQRKEGQIEGSN